MLNTEQIIIVVISGVISVLGTIAGGVCIWNCTRNKSKDNDEQVITIHKKTTETEEGGYDVENPFIPSSEIDTIDKKKKDDEHELDKFSTTNNLESSSVPSDIKTPPAEFEVSVTRKETVAVPLAKPTLSPQFNQSDSSLLLSIANASSLNASKNLDTGNNRPKSYTSPPQHEKTNKSPTTSPKITRVIEETVTYRGKHQSEQSSTAVSAHYEGKKDKASESKPFAVKSAPTTPLIKSKAKFKWDDDSVSSLNSSVALDSSLKLQHSGKIIAPKLGNSTNPLIGSNKQSTKDKNSDSETSRPQSPLSPNIEITSDDVDTLTQVNSALPHTILMNGQQYLISPLPQKSVSGRASPKLAVEEDQNRLAKVNARLEELKRDKEIEKLQREKDELVAKISQSDEDVFDTQSDEALPIAKPATDSAFTLIKPKNKLQYTESDSDHELASNNSDELNTADHDQQLNHLNFLHNLPVNSEHLTKVGDLLGNFIEHIQH